MKISQLKSILQESKTISFQLPNGTLVPNHFHVTEIGKVSKDFIDCGGVQRSEIKASLQLWKAHDYDHRLHPEKLLNIIHLSERILGIGDLEIEVEYQGDTIGKYQLDYDGGRFLLVGTRTACLALDACKVVEDKPKLDLSNLSANTCTPGSGCC